MGTRLQLIYGMASPPISRSRKVVRGSKLLGLRGQRVNFHAFIRCYRIKGELPENAVSRCEAQIEFLYSQKILLRRLPRNCDLRAYYIDLEKRWLQLSSASPYRPPTHFIVCGVIQKTWINKDRILYNPSSSKQVEESVIFKGAFCFLPIGNDSRDPNYIAHTVCQILMSSLENDFENYDGAALDPTKTWILQRIMVAWKALNPD
jgi:hypothetical protein